MFNGIRRFAGVVASAGLAVNVGVAFSAEKDTNTAFVFIKPHANTAAAQALVKKTLVAKGCAVTAEGELTAEAIVRAAAAAEARRRRA